LALRTAENAHSTTFMNKSKKRKGSQEEEQRTEQSVDDLVLTPSTDVDRIDLAVEMARRIRANPTPGGASASVALVPAGEPTGFSSGFSSSSCSQKR
jgi:hypothetical protein